eukprot:365609-Chlamydomonas_euryale.AAC.6
MAAGFLHRRSGHGHRGGANSALPLPSLPHLPDTGRSAHDAEARKCKAGPTCSLGSTSMSLSCAHAFWKPRDPRHPWCSTTEAAPTQGLGLGFRGLGV